MKWIVGEKPKQTGEYFIEMYHDNAPDEVHKETAKFNIKKGWLDFAPGWNIIKYLDESPLTSSPEWVSEKESIELKEKLQLIFSKAQHGIPYYAYGDHEAACEMDRLLTEISSIAGHSPSLNWLPPQNKEQP